MSIVTEQKSDWFVSVLGVCAIAVTGLVVRHEFFPPAAAPAQQVSPVLADSLSETNWKELTASGHWIGATNAQVVFVEFSDFQCPSCRTWIRELQSLQTLRPEAVAIVFHHLPLSEIHREAVHAAVASECAADGGRFEAFHNFLFRNQDHLNAALYAEAADSVQLQDLGAFRTCLTDPRIAERVDKDRSRADRLGLTATPTVWVNRLRLSRVPDTAWVDSLSPVAARSR
jgi:protein-disulfide isomerase